MSIKDQLSEEQIIELLRIAKESGQADPSTESIVDVKPAPYQITEDVEDNVIIQKVGGIEKFRHKIKRPDYGTKDLHPDRFIKEADEAISDGFKAKETMAVLHARVEAATLVSSPEKLLEMVLGDSEESLEPAEALKKMTDEVLCGHSGCGKSFKTPKGLQSHKRATAHSEYAEGSEKWEQSLVYARLKAKKAKEAASDETGDTGPDQEGKG